MKLKNQRDFFSGLMFIAAGVAFAWAASRYSIGDAAHMGIGYFPLVLGIVLAGLGALILFGSLVVETEDGEPIGAFAWRPLGCVIAANIAFGLMVGGLGAIGLPPLGLVAAVVVLVAVSALAADRFVPKEVAMLAVVLAVGSYLALVTWLELPLPAWPWFAG